MPQAIKGDYESTAANLRALAEVQGNLSIKLNNIRPPEALRANHQALVFNFSKLAKASQAAGDAIFLEDAYHYEYYWGDIRKFSTEITRLSEQIGVDQCGVK